MTLMCPSEIWVHRFAWIHDGSFKPSQYSLAVAHKFLNCALCAFMKGNGVNAPPGMEAPDDTLETLRVWCRTSSSKCFQVTHLPTQRFIDPRHHYDCNRSDRRGWLQVEDDYKSTATVPPLPYMAPMFSCDDKYCSDEVEDKLLLPNKWKLSVVATVNMLRPYVTLASTSSFQRTCTGFLKNCLDTVDF